MVLDQADIYMEKSETDSHFTQNSTLKVIFISKREK